MFIWACTFSMRVNAQLEVQTSGNVEIGENLEVSGDIICGNNLQVSKYLYVDRSATISKNIEVGNRMHIGKNVAIQTDLDTTIALNVKKIVPIPNYDYSTPHIGVKSHVSTTVASPTLPSYAIYGKVDALNPSGAYPGREMVGICGYACKPYQAANTFAAGVAGISYYYGGIGVYGAICSGDIPTSMGSGTYAGYFNGTVKVNGTLMATAISTTSDERTKENIQELTSEQADIVKLLRPVSYNLKQDSAWIYDKDAKELQGIHYGLIAQEVQNIAPELVYERDDILSINYIELIPLLIMKVQELSVEVEKLKAQ